LRKKIYNDYASILDPALTAAGILKARTLGAHFKDEFFKRFPRSHPVVCASVLLRTQQTACFMLKHDKNDEENHRDEIITDRKPLHILPYISESSSKIAVRLMGNETGQTNDNTPRDFPQQAAKLPDGFPRKKYPEAFPADGNTPSVDKFKHFIHNDPLFTGDNHVFIIFTHGNFLMKLLDSMGLTITKEERPNYAAFSVEYTPGIHRYNAAKFPYFFAKVPNHYFESDRIDRTDECTFEGDPRIGIEQYTCEEKVCDSRASMKPNLTIKSIRSRGGRRMTRKHKTRSHKTRSHKTRSHKTRKHQKHLAINM